MATSIAGYESLKGGRAVSLQLDSLRELPGALIKARIARGWTQEQLARQLDMPKQQIQRYEATEYASASLRRLLEIAKALDIRFSGTVQAGSPAGRAFELATSRAGYSAVEAVQQVERRLRLRHMTSEESRRIFDDLCDTYYHLAPLHGPSRADVSRGIDHRLAVRKALETLVRKRGDVS